MEPKKQLNPAQQEAVNTLEGALLVLAGAGSGKTSVVTQRIINLMQHGVAPEQILGLTFTNKAAEEMRERVRRLTNSNVTISTFHSLGARILRESITHLGYQTHFAIYDEEDSDGVLKACLAEKGLASETAKLYRSLISKAKNAMHSPQEVSDDEAADFSAVYAAYETKLKSYNAVDFDDLLYLPVKLFKEHPNVLEYYQDRWHYLLIDEYQDTNGAQYQFVTNIVRKRPNICVVGDPDQSIYSWRGAKVGNILNFEKDFPGAKVVKLEQNYRSSGNILEAANAVINKNQGRYEKNLWSDFGAGELLRLYTADTERSEAEFVSGRIRYYHEEKGIPYNDMVVFYRTNGQSRVFEDYFRYNRIPYVIVGGISFYQRREVKDILSFLRLIQSPSDFAAFERTINVPKRGLGPTTLDKLHEGAIQSNLPIVTFCEALVSDLPVGGAIKLTAKQKGALKDYISILLHIKALVQHGSLTDVVRETIERTGYLDYLKADPDSFDDRKGNLDSLIAKANERERSGDNPTLSAFLEELALRSTLDEVDADESKVSLMTLHNGKGLEFSLVFLVGLEEQLFPHVNTRNSEDGLEEERRLFYVGMTRAKRHLYLSHCRQRFIWGTTREQWPSRFLREIPFEYIEKYRTPVGYKRHYPQYRY